MSADRSIAILGVGMHPWGKWGRNFVEYGLVAAREAPSRAAAASTSRGTPSNAPTRIQATRGSTPVTWASVSPTWVSTRPSWANRVATDTPIAEPSVTPISA